MANVKCGISRATFSGYAGPVEVVINGVPMTAEVKHFSSGSFGWYLNGKVTLKVGTKPVPVQIGLNLTVVGSKDLAQGSDTVEPVAVAAS